MCGRIKQPLSLVTYGFAGTLTATCRSTHRALTSPPETSPTLPSLSGARAAEGACLCTGVDSALARRSFYRQSYDKLQALLDPARMPQAGELGKKQGVSVKNLFEESSFAAAPRL
jgi:hypothetical protein